ncbi:MAG: TIGR03560 family F420-dependent LLM class oxidoreductase [Thermomicrobiales bacterium]|nr:TIGR03560 family F420-dependent LLM class oxidoreductase [Thermomicrobiales bacterium]
MIDVNLMIEGQDGVNWSRWQKIARAVEEAGYDGLYVSDHFTNPEDAHLDSLELWTSLTWLAGNTERLAFGPVVAPVSFRDPRIAAWTAAAIDGLAPGRLRLGLGAGWMVREHDEWGFDLLDLDARFQRFEESLEVVSRLLHQEGPVTFAGTFYPLDGAEIVPNPIKTNRIPIVIGGNGPRRTVPLAARFADEWNGVYVSHETFKERNALLDKLLAEQGRQPEEVKRTVMTRVIFGKDEAELNERLQGADADELRASGQVVGTADQIAAQIRAWDEAGAAGIMLQWVDDLDDIDGIKALGAAARG